MGAFEVLILSLVEGLTEFLPVSSTGHLIVVGNWLRLEDAESNLAFMVIIQFAAILAVIANYRERFSVRYLQLWVRVALAFFPIALTGLLFATQIKALFQVQVVGLMFILGGLVFLVVEGWYRRREPRVRELDSITGAQAIGIGLAQVLALIPGTSRAGASIVGGLLCGLDRRTSAEFSFLLALPVLAAAAGYDVWKHYEDFDSSGLLMLGLGFLCSFVVAYASIRLFMGFLERFTFVTFGIYRIVFGTLLLML